jgi:hypothetical protein
MFFKTPDSERKNPRAHVQLSGAAQTQTALYARISLNCSFSWARIHKSFRNTGATMSVRVCMRVRMHNVDARACVQKLQSKPWNQTCRAYAHIRTYVHTHINTYTHTYMHTYIHAYIRACIHAYIHTYTYTRTDTCIHTYIYTYIHTHTHAYAHTYMHTYIYTYIHTYMRTWIYTYIHTYIHTHAWRVSAAKLAVEADHKRLPSLHMHTHTYMQAYIHTYTHTHMIHTHVLCIHTYIHTYTHTIHTYTHTIHTHIHKHIRYIHTYIMTYDTYIQIAHRRRRASRWKSFRALLSRYCAIRQSSIAWRTAEAYSSLAMLVQAINLLSRYCAIRQSSIAWRLRRIMLCKLKCFVFELAGQKRTRSDSAVQSQTFRQNFIWNANVSERENRFPLISACQLKCKALYEYVLSRYCAVRQSSITWQLASHVRARPGNIC